MSDLAELVASEWAALKSAPATFFLFFVSACAMAFFFVRWVYARHIEVLKSRLDHKDDQLLEYLQRLHLISPNETAYSRYSNAELRAKALKLVGKVREFAEEGMAYSPPWWESPGWDSMTEDERTQAFREYCERQSRRSQERMARYAEEMKTDAILLRDEMETRLPKKDVADKRIRLTYEHPVNPLVLIMIADNLEKKAKSLPDAELQIKTANPLRRRSGIVGT